MKAKEKITKVEVGQAVRILGFTPEYNRDFLVNESCVSNQGQWACATHGEVFQNQFQKDSHIHEGHHQLAWICFAHGAEVP